MPILLHKKSEEFHLGLWEIKESVDELLQMDILTDVDEQAFHKLRNDQRKIEWLSVRALMKEMFSKCVQISYLDTGKPFLSGESFHISISHTKGMVGVLCSPQAYVGIDIEHKDRPVNKVLHRFLSEDELKRLSSCPEIGITYWCAKECVFKVIDAVNVDFSEEIEIIIPDKEQIIGNYSRDTTRISIPMLQMELNDYIVVYTA